MTLDKQLEIVLRHAYLHGFSPKQWAILTKECLADRHLEQELCELLLSSMFSVTRVSDPLFESYLTIATREDPLISLETFILSLLKYGPQTVHKNPLQWSFLLDLLPTLLTRAVSSDKIVSVLQQGEMHPWVEILSDLFGLLSHIVAVGLYPKSTPDHTPLTSALSFYNMDSQFSLSSQPSMSGLDMDATLDFDTTQREEEQGEDEKKSCRRWIEDENAVAAAQIMIHLIEAQGAKRIFEVRNNLKRQSGQLTDTTGYEPWFSCQNKLVPSDSKENASDVLQNIHVQKLLAYMQRLADRDSERRMAVHMKYHELEDEGTARAMPSAGIMGFLYHLVQIRPSLEDDIVVDHLLKLQIIKGSFDESFYLELWLTALTGLREATLNTSCQGPLLEKEVQENHEKGCNTTVATNRLLWKSLVLVKLPTIINKLQERKKSVQGSNKKSIDEMNPIESSLKELKGFTGLLNACSQSACCTEFYAPDSTYSTLVNKIAFGEVEEEDDEDDIMKMINDMNDSTDLNGSSVIKSIRSLSSNDIYTNLVHVCEYQGFVRPHIVTELSKTENQDFMDLDQDEKLNPSAIVDQNLEQRMESLKANMSFVELTELLHVGLVSCIHLRKVLDFILDMLREKARVNHVHSVSKICEALIECPCSIDLILQLYTPSELLNPLEKICNHWNINNRDTDFDMDESPKREEWDGVRLLYIKFGKIWHLVASVVKQFKLQRNLKRVFKEHHGFTFQFFQRGQIIYGKDTKDTTKEELIESWLSALTGRVDFNSVFESTQPQDLLMITPTLVHRSILLYPQGETLMKIMSHFQLPFLDFIQPNLLLLLCEELLNGESSALACLGLFIPQSRHTRLVLGPFESLLEYKQQESVFLSKEETEVNEREIREISEWIELILTNNRMKHLTEDDLSRTETVTTGVTPDTLFEKTQMMFRYIVKSGRSMFMSDVDANTSSLWDHSPASKSHVISHYLDMVLFETALEMGGGHWFVSMIVSEVLEAGKSGGAVRAAELGSCLISTSLSSNKHNDSIHLLSCLLQDILPTFLEECAQENMSFFQGQTLGVFTSDCLVLMQDQKSESATKLGAYFFGTLVIEGHDTRKKISEKKDETRFAEWSTKVTESAVWRGFIKGLMSNPMVEEIWPNAFI